MSGQKGGKERVNTRKTGMKTERNRSQATVSTHSVRTSSWQQPNETNTELLLLLHQPCSNYSSCNYNTTQHIIYMTVCVCTTTISMCTITNSEHRVPCGRCFFIVCATHSHKQSPARPGKIRDWNVYRCECSCGYITLHSTAERAKRMRWIKGSIPSLPLLLWVFVCCVSTISRHFDLPV